MLNAGTTALVTGGSGGIGSEVSKTLASRGVHVIAASNDKAKLARLDGMTRIETCFVDVTDEAAVNAYFSDRPIDIVINAAGLLGVTGTIYSVPTASAKSIFEVNVVGIHNVLSAVVPGMLKRNRGHIINFGSIAGPYPSVGQPMYSASKAAVHNMSMNLRLELFGTDIKVTEIRPGRVRSGMHAEMFEGNQARAEEILYAPYECMDGVDVANVIAFVLDTPPHVCVSQIEVVPTHQVYGGTKMFQREAGRK